MRDYDQLAPRHTHRLPRYVPTCLRWAISPCTFRRRSVSIKRPSKGSARELGPAPGVDKGVSAGLGDVEGDDRKEDNEVI